MAVYVLQFAQPFGKQKNPSANIKRVAVNFYTGWTPDNKLDQRIQAHRTGKGAFITAAAAAQGVGMEVVALWDNLSNQESWLLEKKLKGRKGTAKFLAALRQGKLPKGFPPPTFLY